MPLIFASSLLGLPLALARLTDSAALEGAASSLGPGGALYLPVNVALIAFFNYYYTFLQVCIIQDVLWQGVLSRQGVTKGH